VHAAYAAASVLFFPSLEEGFGWPIAEAMACGCSVITTDHAPMTEVGGGAASYLPRLPWEQTERVQWAVEAASLLAEIIQADHLERENWISRGLENAKRFDLAMTLDAYEGEYRKVL